MATPRAILKWLEQQLPAWEEAGWVTPGGANAIRDKYGASDNPPEPVNYLFTAVSILGVTLLGGGVILLFAYNWNTLGRGIRTILSLLPLFLAQGATVFTLLRKPSGTAWREGCAAGIITGVAAGIALIGQTYNIQGNLGSFLFIWMLLSAPLVILLRSSLTGFVLMIQFLFWMGYSRMLADQFYEGWLVFLCLVACTTWLQVAEKREIPILNLLATFVASVLLLVASGFEIWYGWLLLISAWFSLLYSLGRIFNDYRTGRIVAIFSGVGLLILLLAATYSDFWRNSSYPRYYFDGFKVEMIVMAGLYGTNILLLVSRWPSGTFVSRVVLLAPFVAATGWFFAVYGHGLVVAIALNVLSILFGLSLVFMSWKSGYGGGMRSGVSLIAAILFLRFFDYDFSLLTRGIAFIVFGSVFLGINFWLNRRIGKEAAK